MNKTKNNQLVGNAGLFYICYELSKRGWNCLVTTRNAKGVDLVIYSQDGKRKYAIQAKSLSKKTPVPFGSKPIFMADFVIICRNVFDDPEIFVFDSKEVRNRLCKRKGDKGNESYRLQLNSYKKYKDRWDIIGEGFSK